MQQVKNCISYLEVKDDNKIVPLIDYRRMVVIVTNY
jgi:hypothetical protein